MSEEDEVLFTERDHQALYAERYRWAALASRMKPRRATSRRQRAVAERLALLDRKLDAVEVIKRRFPPSPRTEG